MTVEELEKDIQEKQAKYDEEVKEGHKPHEGRPRALSEINAPNIQPVLAIPFALLLLSIALMPFINQHFWEHHFPDFAFCLGGIMIAYYIVALNGFTTLTGDPHYGRHKMIHVGLEYFQFIALVGSLYVVTGGILIRFRGLGTPVINTGILAVGAVLANVIGTTGASALLIRSYIKVNKHRVRAFHVMLFIFIVSNCGGCLTPIGDPPLFLGYLQGVPFGWTMVHCLPAWALCVGVLLTIFFVLDTMAIKKYRQEQSSAEAAEPFGVSIAGVANFFFLGLVLLGVFLDTLLEPLHLPHAPYGAILQVVAATLAYKLSNPDNLKGNEFTFGPIKEVGFLFVGLFATMVPALDYLGNNAGKLGVSTPTAFYFASGALSSFLDNAPTYLNFLSAAHGLAGLEMGKAATKTFAWLDLHTVGSTGVHPFRFLLAISLGSVFFGANTYIGNAPNFMVKAISETSGVKMPSFFGYIVAYAIPILIPTFIVIWFIFVSGHVL
ncbi:MAG: sodium:proton antiporter [Planctomycetota bacterium]|nr:sodium:proton antiporter [Planctomycetota bacterium]